MQLELKMYKKRLFQPSSLDIQFIKYREVLEEHILHFHFYFEHDILLGNASGSAGNFFNWDRNEDGVISRDEVSPQEIFS